MAQLSETQKQISRLLMQGPKTAEEIAGSISMPYSKLMEELKEMLRLELIKKEGFPTKYGLKKEIVERVQERKRIEEKDFFKIRLSCIIEVQAIEEELLKKSLKEIEEMLRHEKIFTIYDCRQAEIVKEGEYYSSFLEVNLSVRDFKAMVRLMFYYAPITIEVLKPEKIELYAGDLQEALVDMAGLVHAYADQITKLMNRKELEQFNNSLYGK
ncbi:MAG: hypothetical protein J4478_03720 [Candidatus Diapherotrites archaeon]|uniref:Uncharacterized protein n=1 Tax=Candidatus Iainarchaeum sp. TaxID=3101447 RepID=A0A7J4JTF7_9ARCH|nr:hypothetical protein [Candidatus Diapherotrites archaeon]HIH21072.1 hypothetical protein [Candidatus Diapherotrites archaeon]